MSHDPPGDTATGGAPPENAATGGAPPENAATGGAPRDKEPFSWTVHQILASTEEDTLLGDLLDAIPIGVIVMDEKGAVVGYNLAEQQLAHRSRASVLGKNFFREVAPCTATSDLVPAFERYAAEGGKLSVDLAFQFRFPHHTGPRDVKLRLRGFDSRAQRFAFLLVEDVTEEVQAGRLRELLATLVAHDMKSPLTAIRVNVDSVLREMQTQGKGGDVSVSERLGDARFAAERLDRMIRLFLDVYRLEHSDLQVIHGRVDAQALLGDVVRLLGPVAQNFGLELSMEGQGLMIRTDAGLLQRVIENLVDNAIRHARHRIRLVVRPAGEEVEIEVIDDGQGVPEEARARIFDKFASMSADLQGYNQGLGLTFCALAADRLGGTIRVLDASPSGALFQLRLPRA